MRIVDLRPGDLLIKYNIIKFLLAHDVRTEQRNTALTLVWLVRWTSGRVEMLTENLSWMSPETRVAEDYKIVIGKDTGR